MKEISYIIRDKMGLHARPAGFLVKKAAVYPCKVTIESGGRTADAKKVFALVGLNVKCGQEIILRADGEQEAEAIKELAAFLKDNL